MCRYEKNIRFLNLLKIKNFIALIISAKSKNGVFFGSPQKNLNPHPCQKIFQICLILLVKGMAADHFAKKIMCLTLIEAEKFQIRFSFNNFSNLKKYALAEKSTSF